MPFARSEGRIQSLHQSSYVAPSSISLADDFTADYAEIYRIQPEVRVVVDFLARNIGQLALQTFQRRGDNDRRRLTDHPLAQLLKRPNSFTTGDRLVRETIADRGIYDRALWIKSYDKTTRVLLRIPPSMWRIDNDGTNWLRPESFIVQGARGEFKVPADQVVYMRGYNPMDTRVGLSPIESLRRTLSESHASSVMREQTMRNGARMSGYITRPKDAKWSPEARTRFKSGWRGQYQGLTATEGGGTPVLEDGMTFVSASQTAAELEYVAARKLTREEVAAAYFIPPPMLGILDNATFSNITEQHKMLYQDTLGPHLSEFEAEIDLQLLPDYGDDRIYVEFNMMEKLQGSFEEQAKSLFQATGRPWLVVNEARARMNLSPIEGGDDLAVPLNLSVGEPAEPELEEIVVEPEPPAAIEAAA